MWKFLIGVVALVFASTSFASEPTEKDAVAMVNKALAAVKAEGRDKLIARVNAKDPEFLQGELYVFVWTLDGTIVGHPVSPKNVGKNMLEVPDVDGKMFRKEIIQVVNGKGQGWVNYRIRNPDSGKVEAKKSYVVKSGDLVLGAGIYQ